MVQIENITKIYDKDVYALNDVSLTFDNYGLHVITGKSGSGKSTLLNVIALLENIDDGKIIVDDIAISDLKSNQKDKYRGGLFSFIFQEYNLIEDKTVRENLELCVSDFGLENDRISNVLKKVGLLEYKDQEVKKLSGGERQRVTIARALIKNTRIILADEPTGNLDNETGRTIMDLIKEISKDHLIILVTHNLAFANEYADRLIKIDEGKIIEDKFINQQIGKLEMNYSSMMLKNNLRTFGLKNDVFPTLKKARKNITRFMIIFLFAIFLLSVSFLFYTTDDATLVQDNLTSFGFNLYKIGKFDDDEKKFETKQVLLGEDYQFLKDKGIKVYPYILINTSLYYNDFYNIYSSSLIFIEEYNKQFDLIIGNYPTNPYEVLISDFDAQVILMSEYDSSIKMQNLVGKNIRATINNYEFNLKISGIYKTDYKKYIDSIERSTLANKLFGEKDNYISAFVSLPSTFSDISKRVDYSYTLIENNNYVSDYGIMNLNEHNQEHVLYLDEDKTGGVLITISYLIEQFGYHYNELFDNPKSIYEEIEKTITLNIDGTKISFDIAGIIDNFSYEAGPYINSAVIAVPSNRIFDYAVSAGLMLDLSDSSSLSTAQKHNYNIHTEITFFENITKTYTVVRGISLFIACILLLIYFILFSGFIMFSIEERKYNIGVYRAVGISKNVISWIFLMETFILSLIEIFMISVIIFPVLILFHHFPVLGTSLNMILFDFNIGALLILLMIVFVLNFMITYFSINKLNNKPITSIIRNI